jgi:hypothetical protein
MECCTCVIFLIQRTRLQFVHRVKDNKGCIVNNHDMVVHPPRIPFPLESYADSNTRTMNELGTLDSCAYAAVTSNIPYHCLFSI